MIDIDKLKQRITEALRAGIPVIARYTKLHTESTGRIQIGIARIGSAFVQEDVSFLGEWSPAQPPFVAVDSDPEYACLMMVVEPIHNVEHRVFGSGSHVDLVRSFGIKRILTRETLIAIVAEEPSIMGILRRIAKLN